jgi:hypothetical protein
MLGQSEHWAGKSLYVRGTVLRVQRMGAGKNPLGIDEYHVLWIKPETRSSYPICVYTVAPPESLTLPVSERERTVNVPVEGPARFFKVRMFTSDQGAAQAPLLLAATMNLQPQLAGDDEEAEGAGEFPSVWTIVGVVAALAAIAILIAWLVWRASFVRRSRLRTPSEQVDRTMDRLENDPGIENVREKLKRLEDDAQ